MHNTHKPVLKDFHKEMVASVRSNLTISVNSRAT